MSLYPLIIIAIPKSASTSLIGTLSGLNSVPAQQMSMTNCLPPKEMDLLPKYHYDIREISVNDLAALESGALYKQHIPPTDNNIALLKPYKKVVLLRSTTDRVNPRFS